MDYVATSGNSSRRMYEAQSNPYKDRVPLSFVAYLRVVRGMFTGLLVAAAIAFIGAWTHREWMALIALFCVVLWSGYEAAKLRSCYLFTDPSGVWVAFGVFPWQKGVSGLSWRQVGGAGYQNGFGSWLLGSYGVHVQGRFNANAGFILLDVKNGDAVASHINQMLSSSGGFADHGR